MSYPLTEQTAGAAFRRERTSRVKAKAPAKINLTLAVLGKRPDGFHEIESLVLPISLCDEIEFLARPQPGIELWCSDPALPTDSANLVWRAGEEILRHATATVGLSIRLHKAIPAGAGLGGGSSDAATTLSALNAMLGLGLTDEDLREAAAKIGSDVPLFLQPGASIIRGRGERIEAVEMNYRGWVALVVPPFAMSTADVYRQWVGQGDAPRSAWDVVEAYRRGEPLPSLLYNMLERPAFALEPRLAELHAALGDLGAVGARMTGSGSALFALFDERSEVQAFATRVEQELGVPVHVLQSYTSEHP